MEALRLISACSNVDRIFSFWSFIPRCAAKISCGKNIEWIVWSAAALKHKLIKLPATTWPPNNKSHYDLSTLRPGFYWRSIYGWRLLKYISECNRTTLASDTKWTGRYFWKKLQNENEHREWILWLFRFFTLRLGRAKKRKSFFSWRVIPLNTRRSKEKNLQASNFYPKLLSIQ